jgi:hypothetical protein
VKLKKDRNSWIFDFFAEEVGRVERKPKLKKRFSSEDHEHFFCDLNQFSISLFLILPTRLSRKGHLFD